MSTVKVGWECKNCNKTRWVEDVPARGDYDLMYWIEWVVMYKLADDHKKQSPYCFGGHLDIKMPIGNDGRVGTEGTAAKEIVEEYKKQIQEGK